MRINKFVAQATGMSRRAADDVIASGRIFVNGDKPTSGFSVGEDDIVALDGNVLYLNLEVITVMLNKPIGYVVSRNGQGSRTVYDLLPHELQHLKPVGRLDKESSGLLLLTTDGELANKLTHPSYKKRKVYEIALDKPLQPLHRQIIAEKGLTLADGISKLGLDRIIDGDETQWFVSMHEGRNRQVRRTFESLGYGVTRLHRTEFGEYKLNELRTGKIKSAY